MVNVPDIDSGLRSPGNAEQRFRLPAICLELSDSMADIGELG